MQKEKKKENWSYREQEALLLCPLHQPTVRFHIPLTYISNTRAEKGEGSGRGAFALLRVFTELCTQLKWAVGWNLPLAEEMAHPGPSPSPAACRPSKTQQGSDGEGRTAFVIRPFPWCGRLKDGGYWASARDTTASWGVRGTHTNQIHSSYTSRMIKCKRGKKSRMRETWAGFTLPLGTAGAHWQVRVRRDRRSPGDPSSSSSQSKSLGLARLKGRF